MMPVHVDTASASAVAAKNIFVGSELCGGVAGDACGWLWDLKFPDHPALPHQTWSNWMEQPFGEEVKASPSYATVRDARGCWEVRRNCRERSRAGQTSVGHP